VAIHADSCCRERLDRPLWSEAGGGSEDELNKKMKVNEEIDKIETKIKEENRKKSQDKNEEKRKLKRRWHSCNEKPQVSCSESENLRISLPI
jgi:hypothetical protein